MKKFASAALITACVFFAGAYASVAHAQVGFASYYRSGPNANGERFNPQGMTAAHRSLPFGTRVRVENVRTRKSVVVRINDRGPFVRGRVIDLAFGAARMIGLHAMGIAKVSLQVVR